MNQNLKQIKDDFASLKLIAEAPKLYISSYFSHLRNEIDLSCTCFIGKNELIMSDATRDQESMINKINCFEKECLSELKIDSENVQQLKKAIETIEEKLNDTVWVEIYAKANDVAALDQMTYEILCKMQKQMFLGKTFVFLTAESFPNTEIETFGKLLIVQDEFIGKRAIEKLEHLEKRYSSINSASANDTDCEDLDLEEPDDIIEKMNNEILKSLYLVQYIKDSMENIEPVEDVVLQSNSEDTCNIKHYRLLTEIDSNLFSGMKNLKEIRISSNYDLKSLQVDNLFTSLDNLTSVNLSFNSLTEISPTLFKGLKNLKEIDLSNNHLRSICSDQFKCLTALNRITISYNEISSIDTDSFHGLENLQTIDLNGNQLSTLNSGIFKSLYSLETIHLLCNPLRTLSSALFQDLTNLKYVALKKWDNLKAARDLIADLITDEMSEKFIKN